MFFFSPGLCSVLPWAGVSYTRFVLVSYLMLWVVYTWAWWGLCLLSRVPARTAREHGLINVTLQWRYKKHDGVSNNKPHDCLPNRSFRYSWKEISKLRGTDLCEGNSPVTGEYPAQRASDAQTASLLCTHHFMADHFLDKIEKLNNWPCPCRSAIRQ